MKKTFPLIVALLFSHIKCADILPDPNVSTYPIIGISGSFEYSGTWLLSGSSIADEGYRYPVDQGHSFVISTINSALSSPYHSYITFIAPKTGKYRFQISGSVYGWVPSTPFARDGGSNTYGGMTLYLGKNNETSGLASGKYLNVGIGGTPGTYYEISASPTIDEEIELNAGDRIRIAGIERSEWTLAGARISVNVTDASTIEIPTGSLTLSKSRSRGNSTIMVTSRIN
jgi:hypothetical protein